MIWQLFALVCSLSYAFQNLVVKGLTRRRVSSISLLWYMFAGSVPLLLLFYQTVVTPVIEPLFPVFLICGVSLNLFAFYGYVRALELSDVSLVAPLLSLSPLFMLFMSWVMVDELPDLFGLFGILAIVVGTYFLSRTKGEMNPFRKLLRDPGVRWALVVSFVWSVTANFDKLAVETSTPLTYSFWFHTIFALALTPVFLYARRDREHQTNKDSYNVTYLIMFGLLLTGLSQAIMSATQMIALIRTKVTYVIAIKRAGMLVSVLGGGLLFGEEETVERFFASALVFIGLIGIMFR